jgi:hypothetical protein
VDKHDSKENININKENDIYEVDDIEKENKIKKLGFDKQDLEY